MSSTREPHGAESPSPKPDDDVVGHKEVEELRIILGRATKRIQKLETELDHSRQQVAWFHRQLFGQKGERVRAADLETAWHAFVKEQELKASAVAKPLTAELASLQLLLGFAGADAEALAEAPPSSGQSQEAPTASADAPAPTAPPKKKGHGRNRVPLTLREESIVLRPDPDEIPDGAREMSAEVSYRLAVRPAELVRIAVIRPQYAIDQDADATRIITAEPPDEMIPRGLFAPSGLAHVIASKWDRHVPYNRLGRFFASGGYRLPVSTLSGVAIRAAPLAKTLVDAMQRLARSIAPYLAIDATGALLRQPEVCLRGHTWVRYIEDLCVLVSFTKTHDSESAGAQLDGWSCPTLADGAGVYDRKQRETQNGRGGCWSHSRRKLVYSAPTDGRALVGLKMINELFAIEAELIDASNAHRLAERRRRSAPIVDKLFAWRDGLLATGNLGRSLLAKSLRYLRNQAERLLYFLSDGAIPIHNNLAELQIRHFAVGRKNWLFYGSETGAEAGSIWLSLVLTARMHDLHVEEYLRDLFRVLPSWPQHRILELAPHCWPATRAKLNPLELLRELGPITIPSR